MPASREMRAPSVQAGKTVSGAPARPGPRAPPGRRGRAGWPGSMTSGPWSIVAMPPGMRSSSVLRPGRASRTLASSASMSLEDLFDRLRRHPAPVELDAAVGGDHARLLAALDRAHVDGRKAQHRVAPALELRARAPVSTSETKWAAAAMALTPASGVLPWAALPVKTTSSHSSPLWPMATRFSVGSPMTAPSALKPLLIRASAPRLSISSSMTAARVIWPDPGAPRSP